MSIDETSAVPLSVLAQAVLRRGTASAIHELDMLT